jgi:digeranylgeranylglycerophospholipid reductase
MNLFDVLVVGASVSGCRTAELLAEKGYKVAIVEEHKKVGLPLKCTGLVSWRLKELLPNLPKEIVVNTIREAKFFSPSGNSFTLHSKRPVYVIDRKGLDEHLFSCALSTGSKPMLGIKFLSFDTKTGTANTSAGNLKTLLLVGADGGNSYVARSVGLEQTRTKLIGVQATVKGEFENFAELWFGNSVAPNFFAWVVPLNESIVRIGLATNTQPLYYFRKFLRKRAKTFVKPDTAGLIRIGLMKKTVADRTLLVGDAACMIKPFSGGGIVYSLIGSRICAEACIKALEERDFSCRFLKKAYEKEWKKILSKPIKRGMLYRRILNNLSDFQLNIFFSFVKKFGLTMLENFDMDFLD